MGSNFDRTHETIKQLQAVVDAAVAIQGAIDCDGAISEVPNKKFQAARVALDDALNALFAD